ncbi:MAG: ribA/ribD-fused uncharacterized protein [Crocinitomicaceae bacterium]|jgi:ribA/ribD-fused uncharacterized protein
MKYTVNSLITSTKEHKYLFFWGHRPSLSGMITSSCFSQWWPCSFRHDGIEYKSSEHWMMAEKSRLFNDTEIAEQIIESDSAAKAKALGRAVKGFDAAIWDKNKFEIVKKGNRLKFDQNDDLKFYLLGTHKRILVEASPVDPVWGIGLSADHRDVYNPEKWRGENLLGFALMEVREDLKN